MHACVIVIPLIGLFILSSGINIVTNVYSHNNITSIITS